MVKIFISHRVAGKLLLSNPDAHTPDLYSIALHFPKLAESFKNIIPLGFNGHHSTNQSINQSITEPSPRIPAGWNWIGNCLFRLNIQ